MITHHPIDNRDSEIYLQRFNQVEFIPLSSFRVSPMPPIVEPVCRLGRQRRRIQTRPVALGRFPDELFVALVTVVDQVPLLRENHVLVHEAQVLNWHLGMGLDTFIDASGLPSRPDPGGGCRLVCQQPWEPPLRGRSGPGHLPSVNANQAGVAAFGRGLQDVQARLEQAERQVV